MRPRHYGRTPGRPIIPPGWAAEHRPVAAGTMTATCEIRQPNGEPVPDPVTYDLVPTPGEVILTNVPCRVVRQNQDRVQAVGGQQVTVADYLITIPYSDDPIPVDAVVEILTASDEVLVDRSFTVTQMLVGSLVWERDLYVIDNSQ